MTTRNIRQQANVARALNEQRTVAKSTLEASVLVEYTNAPILKCKAKESFVKGNARVQAGQEFFLVQSSKFANRYYVVVWDEHMTRWQCSCYCACSNRAHTEIVKTWIVEHVVRPKIAAVVAPDSVKVASGVQAVKMAAATTNDAPAPRTAQEWHGAIAAQKEADKAYNRAYLNEARKLRNAS